MTISDHPIGKGNVCNVGRAFYESTINSIFLYTKRLMLLIYIEDSLVACPPMERSVMVSNKVAN